MIGLLSVIEPSILGVQVAYGGYVAWGPRPVRHRAAHPAGRYAHHGRHPGDRRQDGDIAQRRRLRRVARRRTPRRIRHRSGEVADEPPSKKA